MYHLEIIDINQNCKVNWIMDIYLLLYIAGILNRPNFYANMNICKCIHVELVHKKLKRFGLTTNVR